MKAYLQLYKARVLELLPPSFFTAFWFLTIDSVYFPAKSYSEKLEDIKVAQTILRKSSNKAPHVEIKKIHKNWKPYYKNWPKNKSSKEENSLILSVKLASANYKLRFSKAETNKKIKNRTPSFNSLKCLFKYASPYSDLPTTSDDAW